MCISNSRTRVRINWRCAETACEAEAVAMILPWCYHRPLLRGEGAPPEAPCPAGGTARFCAILRLWSSKCATLILGHASDAINQVYSLYILYYTKYILYYIYIWFPSGKSLGEWRKNETDNIQRGASTTHYAGNSRRIVLIWTLIIHERTLHFRTGRSFFLGYTWNARSVWETNSLELRNVSYFVQYDIVEAEAGS